MSSTILYFTVTIIIGLALLLINFIFAPHNPYKEKNNPFECGYTSFLGQNRIQFSISFFVFALLFLLFDLELILVYPYLLSSYINEFSGLIAILGFLLLLILGFGFELQKKALFIESRQNREPSNTEKPNEDPNNSSFLISKSTSLYNPFVSKRSFSTTRVLKMDHDSNNFIDTGNADNTNNNTSQDNTFADSQYRDDSTDDVGRISEFNNPDISGAKDYEEAKERCRQVIETSDMIEDHIDRIDSVIDDNQPSEEDRQRAGFDHDPLNLGSDPRLYRDYDEYCANLENQKDELIPVLSQLEDNLSKGKQTWGEQIVNEALQEGESHNDNYESGDQNNLVASNDCNDFLKSIIDFLGNCSDYQTYFLLLKIASLIYRYVPAYLLLIMIKIVTNKTKYVMKCMINYMTRFIDIHRTCISKTDKNSISKHFCISKNTTRYSSTKNGTLLTNNSSLSRYRKGYLAKKKFH